MTALRFEDGLLYTDASLVYKGNRLALTRAIVDTGAARTIVASGAVELVNMEAEATDEIRQVRGVGGSELVYTKLVERFSIGSIFVEPFEIEVVVMDYGIPIDALIGLDFLMAIEAVIDLEKRVIYPAVTD